MSTTYSIANPGRRFMARSKLAGGRQKKNGGLIELTVYITPEQLEALRTRAAANDLSLSAQMRVDIERANHRFNGNI
jgi:hypothetical protein